MELKKEEDKEIGLKKEKKKMPRPTKVEEIFIEAGYDLDEGIRWSQVSSDEKLIETLKKTKGLPIEQVYDFVYDNYTLTNNRRANLEKEHGKEGRVFTEKYMNRKRSVEAKLLMEWYTANILEIEPIKGPERF